MILQRFLIYFVIAIIGVSCNPFQGPKKPHNLISKEKMVAILIDAKLLSTASSVNKRIMQNKGVDIDNYIYAKHQIDSLQFALSNNYYAFHVKDYDDIYNKVTDSLEALKTKYKNIEAQEWKDKTKREEDSLNTVLLKQKDTLEQETMPNFDVEKKIINKNTKNKVLPDSFKKDISKQ